MDEFMGGGFRLTMPSIFRKTSILLSTRVKVLGDVVSGVEKQPAPAKKREILPPDWPTVLQK
jgi:hypothetical protein